MSTDVLRCGSSVSHMSDAWSRDAVAASTTEGTDSMSVSAAELRSKLLRPKSVPPSLQKAAEERQLLDPSRPHTTAGTRVGCDRVYQVEHEPTRKHNLSASLPRRKIKQQPWQKHLDGNLVPHMTSHGFILSKSKDKIAVQIHPEDFFHPENLVHKTGSRKGSPESLSANSKRSASPNNHVASPNIQITSADGADKGDALLLQLQGQLADLQLFLEEERFSHRQTKYQAAEHLKEKMKEMEDVHDEDINKIEEEHAEEMGKLEERLQHQIEDNATAYDAELSKRQGEIEFLHGAFESYKSQLHQETEDRWKKREHDVRVQHDEEMQKQLHELRSRMIAERNAEKADTNKQHQKDIETLRREHKKEMDGLLRRFSNAAADLERLKIVQAELEVTLKELEDVKKQYDETCRQTTELTRDLTDTKVKLITFEQEFQHKVQSVDDKYRQQIHDLMSENTELRRVYNRKCGELVEEKANTDRVQSEQLQNAKNTMKLTSRSPTPDPGPLAIIGKKRF